MIVPYPLLFGISGGEVLILLLLVLLLFGPKKIPEIARMIGRGMNEVKKVQREINTEIHRYSSDIEREAREMESEIKNIVDDPASQKTGIQNNSNKNIEDVSADAASGNKPGEKQKQGIDPGHTKLGENAEKPVDGNDNEDLPYPYKREPEEEK